MNSNRLPVQGLAIFQSLIFCAYLPLFSVYSNTGYFEQQQQRLVSFIVDGEGLQFLCSWQVENLVALGPVPQGTVPRLSSSSSSSSSSLPLQLYLTLQSAALRR